MDRTLKQWNKRGYMVRKGEHAKRANANGVALFSPEQVVPQRYTKYTGRPYSAGEHPDPWVDYEDGIWGPEDEVAMDYY